MSTHMRSMKGLIDAVDHVGKDFISITDMTTDQLYSLFEVGKNLELFNRSKIDLLDDRMLALIFFQPSTRTRMSFQTAMERLGGHVIVEANPKVTSSVAKEESIEDTMRCISQYANLLVLRHYDADEARRRFGRIEGLNVAVVSPDMIEARTGHSMAAGLACFGANVTICSDSDRRTPADVRERILSYGDVSLKEEFAFEQDTFNEFILTQDLIYLPGCSAPAGAKAEEFKTLMDRYLVRYETLQEAADKGHQIYVTTRCRVAPARWTCGSTSPRTSSISGRSSSPSPSVWPWSPRSSASDPPPQRHEQHQTTQTTKKGPHHARDQGRRLHLPGPLRGGGTCHGRGVPREAPPARLQDHPRALVRPGRLDPHERPRPGDRTGERHLLPVPRRTPHLPRRRLRDRAAAGVRIRQLRLEGRPARG